MKRLFIGAVIFLFVMTAGVALAYVAASDNYKLEKDSLNFGGTDFSSSTNYLNSDTFGEIISGLTTGSNYNASSGYRYMESETSASVPVLGCTDPKANNYNSLATQNDGSCTYDPIIGGILGCTDPKALNYNKNATIDDGSCLYAGVPNVSNFKALYNGTKKAIRLTWQNPDYPDLQLVMIRRLKDSIPTAPTDGKLIYSSTGESIDDSDIEPGARYYYTAFVKSKDGRYSSGVVATERVPTDDEEISDGGDIFSPFFSTTTEVVTEPTPEWDFRFIQLQEPIKTFDNKMRVRIVGTKDLTILFNYNLAPATLKTIGVTLTDPTDKTKTFSFLMHRNQAGTAYEATIAPLIRRGTYPIDIYIINYDNQAIKRIKGSLIVSGTSISSIIPIAVTTGLVIGFLPSLYNLLIILFRVFGYFFGRRKNDNPWGTVYDSVTKRPLDPVYLTVNQETLPAGQAGKEMATAITDIDGRFSFFLPAGTYVIKANKTHYRFPSERLAGRTADELYDHLYFGGQFATTGEMVINLNIPLDPLDFDWNEFAKTKINFFEFYNRRRLWLNWLYKLIFVSGLLLSIYSCLISPSWWNVVILALYTGLLIVNRFWRGYGKPWQVIRASTGEPLPFAIIRVFLPDLNQQIKSVVTDKLGRFYLLVRPGVYYYTVEEKQLDGSYLKVFQSNSLSLSQGVLTEDINVT